MPYGYLCPYAFPRRRECERISKNIIKSLIYHEDHEGHEEKN